MKEATKVDKAATGRPHRWPQFPVDRFPGRRPPTRESAPTVSRSGKAAACVQRRKWVHPVKVGTKKAWWAFGQRADRTWGRCCPSPSDKNPLGGFTAPRGVPYCGQLVAPWMAGPGEVGGLGSAGKQGVGAPGLLVGTASRHDRLKGRRA